MPTDRMTTKKERILIAFGIGTILVLVGIYLVHLRDSSRSALAVFSEAPTPTISDLRSLLDEDPTHRKRGRAVIFRGIVRPRQGYRGVIARLSGREAVFVKTTQRFTYTEKDSGTCTKSCEVHCTKSCSGSSSRSSEWTAVNKVPFVLVEDDGSPNPAYVHVSHDSDSFPLVLAYSNRRYDGDATFKETEHILPVGKNVTAVGICRRTNNGDIEIRPCYDVSRFLEEPSVTKGDIVRGLNDTIQFAGFWIIVLKIVSVGWLPYTLWIIFSRDPSTTKENVDATGSCTASTTREDGDVTGSCTAEDF